MSETNQKKKAAFLAVLFLVSSLFLFAFLAIGFFTFRFSKLTGLGTNQMLKGAWAGFTNPYNKKYLTVLVLGLDSRENDNSLLTDTILLATINVKSGDYLLFSIPRDLWLEDLKTKINALYYYGQKQDPDDGSQLVKKRLEEILDWPIDYLSLFKMEQIKDLIDRVGGVEVEVGQAFSDQQFPKDDGSGEVMTVSFKEGKQMFGGEKALQFMRSRKSQDPVESTDEARQKRQKQVILALQKKLLTQKTLWLDLSLMANLFNFATQEIKTNPRLDLITLVSFWSVGRSVAFGGQSRELELDWQSEDSILTAKREPNNNAWILLPKGNDWQLIEDYFHKNLP